MRKLFTLVSIVVLAAAAWSQTAPKTPAKSQIRKHLNFLQTDGTTTLTEYQTVTTLTPNMVQTMCHNSANQLVVVTEYPGAGNMVVVDSISLNLQYQGTPYAGNPLAQVQPIYAEYWGGDSIGQVFSVADVESNYSKLRVTMPAITYSFLTGQFGDIGQPVLVTSSNGCYTNGNSPIVVTVNYHIIPAA